MSQSKRWMILLSMGVLLSVLFALLAISGSLLPGAAAAGANMVMLNHIHFPLILDGYYPKAGSITSITSHVPDPSIPGQPVVVSVTVSGVAIPLPTGTVAISGADSNCSILLAAGSGSCSVNFNSTGTRTLTASYSGDGIYSPSSGSASHTVVKGSTSIMITSDTPDPSLPGQAVLVSFSVGGAGVTPTGTVSVTGADINCSIALSGGAGSCAVIFNTIGARILSATYSGDLNYLGSTDTEPHDVKNASVTSIISDVPNPSVPGELVMLGIRVVGDGVIAPTGQVIVTGSDDVGVVSCMLAGGSCTVGVIFNTAGLRILTASYSGDAIHAGSQGTFGHTVSRGTPSVFMITGDSNDPSLVNELVTVQIAILGAGVMPGGTVAISVTGQTGACSITISGGSGQCQIVFDTVGIYTITAIYSGDSNYVGVMDTEMHTVN